MGRISSVKKNLESIMTKQEFREYYGQSVYQARLSAAVAYLHKYQDSDALHLADEFIRMLLAESVKKLEDL